VRRGRVSGPGARARRWEVLTCLLPWGSCSPWQVVVAVTEHGRRPEVPPDAELLAPPLEPAAKACYLALMRRCWATDPAARPSFGEAASALQCAAARTRCRHGPRCCRARC